MRNNQDYSARKISYKNNKGFSYMELMVAMVIIGIIGASFTGIVFTSGKVSNNHKLDLEAITIAQDIIEDARSHRDDKGKLDDWEPKGHLMMDDFTEYAISRGNFTYQVEVRLVNVVGQSNLWQVEVNVTHEASENPVVLVSRISVN